MDVNSRLEFVPVCICGLVLEMSELLRELDIDLVISYFVESVWSYSGVPQEPC